MGIRRAFKTILLGELVLFLFVAACASPVTTPEPGVTEGPSPSGAPAASTTAVPATDPVATQLAGTKLTEEELASITLGGLVPIPADAPQPKVDAIAAETIVRATYHSTRETIEVRRIAMRIHLRVVTGWVVALTPQVGVACALHPGLLPRAIEGGIVDDQTGEMFWSMTCG